jgi:hypothetical protein
MRRPLLHLALYFQTSTLAGQMRLHHQDFPGQTIFQGQFNMLHLDNRNRGVLYYAHPITWHHSISLQMSIAFCRQARGKTRDFCLPPHRNVGQRQNLRSYPMNMGGPSSTPAPASPSLKFKMPPQ